MHQGSRLECVIGALLAEVPPRYALEFRVHKIHQLAPRGCIAGAQFVQQLGDLGIRSANGTSILPAPWTLLAAQKNKTGSCPLILLRAIAKTSRSQNV
jgi:hypothetical protein